jgi:hypothetical protein
MHHIALVITLLITFAGLRAEDNAITAFNIRIDSGKAKTTFRLMDHTLIFSEGNRAEGATTLTDDEVRHTILLLSNNPMLAKKFAAKPVGK